MAYPFLDPHTTSEPLGTKHPPRKRRVDSTQCRDEANLYQISTQQAVHSTTRCHSPSSLSYVVHGRRSHMVRYSLCCQPNPQMDYPRTTILDPNGARHVVHSPQKIRISGCSLGEHVLDQSTRCSIKIAYTEADEGAEREAVLCSLIPGKVCTCIIVR